MQALHQPVLLREVLECLAPVDGGVYVDGNLGMGGHAEAILDQSAPRGVVIGFDLDGEALARAQARLAVFGDRVHYVHRNFADMCETLHDMGIDKVDGVLLDLGLSSFQIDVSGRGFSFKGLEPLDMRMDKRQVLTAAEIINTAGRDELADIFFYYGEERQARRIADFIVEERRKRRFETTEHLVDIIKRAVPRKYYPKKIHVATKVFQGLRIAVNRELDNLDRVLADVPSMIKPGGRFCIISFHSLEDRLVKQAFQKSLELQVLTKKPIMATEEECRLNPRARSAKLRVAERRRKP